MLDRPAMLRRVAIFVMTVGVVFGALAIGQGKQGVTLELGAISNVEFTADRSITVVDEEATEAAREVARAAVEPVLRTDGTVEGEVRSRISEVLDEVETAVVDAPPVISVTPLPEHDCPRRRHGFHDDYDAPSRARHRPGDRVPRRRGRGRSRVR